MTSPIPDGSPSGSTDLAEPDRETVAAVADRLRSALQSRTPCAPVRDLLGTSDIATAYAVQQVLTDDRLARGAQVVGRKIGLTSPAVQRQLGVDQPDFGTLFDDMQVASGGVVPFGTLLQPRVEAEIAFVLGADVEDPDDVRPCVDHAVAALEICDSRIAGWNISITDTVADNASSAFFVLGDRRVALEDFEPAAVLMELSADGSVVSTGSGAACLGDPLHALTWLARAAAALGAPLRAGEIVLSGALGPMVNVTAGMSVTAEITQVGTVATTFGLEKG